MEDGRKPNFNGFRRKHSPIPILPPTLMNDGKVEGSRMGLPNRISLRRNGSSNLTKPERRPEQLASRPIISSNQPQLIVKQYSFSSIAAVRQSTVPEANGPRLVSVEPPHRSRE